MKKTELEKTAHSQGVSINQFALYAFTKELSELETNDYFQNYLKNKKSDEIISNFDNVMNKVKSKDIPQWDQV